MEGSGNLNIVTLGRSGVGKSSLLNYLIGEQRFKTGVGRPVTRKGFFEERSVIDGVPVTFIDSYGIESGDNFKEWQSLLEEQIKKHDLSHSISEWLHVILYCISAEDSRIQPIDCEIIKRFSQEGIKLIVVLTNADRCEEEDCEILKNTLLNQCDALKDDDFVEICSVNEPEEFSGRGLRIMIIEQYVENILKALPEHCILRAKQEISSFKKVMDTEIQSRKYSLFDADSDHGKWLERNCQKFVEKFNKEIYPHIIRNSVDEMICCAKNLGNILQKHAKADETSGSFVSKFNTSLGKSTDLWEDDDPFIEKLAKGTLMTILFVPLAIAAIVYLLIYGEDDVKKELSRANASFAEQLQRQVDDSKPRLEEFFANIRRRIFCD